MVAGKHRKTHNVEQTKKMIPFVTRKTSFGHNIGELVLVSTYLIRILGSKSILSNNHSSTTLWVLDTCLIVGLLPSNDHFEYRFIVFKSVQLRLTVRRIFACGDVVRMR